MLHTDTQASTQVTTCQYIGTELGYTRLQPTCCSPTLAGRSYCEDHLWIVYKQGSATARRKKDIRVANDVHMWESLFNDAVQELVEEGFL